ncbi:TauD/TfdA family dioxygenase [Streptomyces sp. NPDC003077]|uniref:TauD/TfdA dioxygenase family protein n=1 Tax=Streptomyces sp. NPDC003077 TaxID=3154443 RepID=UPI0033A4B22E
MEVVETVRRPFDARLSPAVQTVEVPCVRRMTADQCAEMVEAFNRHGFVILRCRDRTDSRRDLLELKRYFGRSTPHPRADEEGVVAINPFKRVAGFLGSTRAEHLLHTDGAFRDDPEKIITLQCVTPAARGGLSVLASGQAAYEHLERRFPGGIKGLTEPDALTITRTTQSSTQPVFRRDHGTCSIKFRMEDGVSEVVPRSDVRDQFRELCRFFTAPENHLRFRLEAGDVLIGDNCAILHGRTSFAPDERRDVRRLNFDASGPLCDRMVFGFRPECHGG